ncbi:hypothetical protein GCM10022254_33010 [Actinomadura meridiana]|uniref:Excreted virulence factor EspC, type VII ESX diderm n=1 Tax=Actinomadura meridiana TaxID=559626 RepID=A0ABP8C2S4_9ACTN
MTQFGVDKSGLRNAAKTMDRFSDSASKIRADAHQADVDGLTWGGLGQLVQLPNKYQDLAESIYDSLDDIAEFLGKSSLALDKSAENYHVADEAIIKHLSKVLKNLGEIESG